VSQRLTPGLLLDAYSQGVFPMGDERGRIAWYSPDPRTIFDPHNFHIPHNLKKVLRRKLFEIRVNTAFSEVLAGCADRPGGTWITGPIVSAYESLHAHGYAHSVETWQDGKLVGGLYGVTLGGAFFGESMFHRVSESSKVALVWLLERLRDRGYVLCDTQWSTPHLRWFGAIDLPRAEYLRKLEGALAVRATFV
jgi:leucyl/phenylalanyl-tRNA--protein transferase